MNKIKTEILADIEQGLFKLFGKVRTDKDIHVSQMYDFCVRRFCYTKIFNQPYQKQVYYPAGMYLTRGIGLKYEDLIAESFKATQKSKIQQKVRLKIEIVDNVYLSGEIDIIYKNTIIDVKSMKPDDWDADIINKAYFNQIQYYLWLCKLLKLSVNTDFGFLCCCRKLQKPNPIKLIEVIQDHERITTEVKKIQKDLLNFFDKNKLPKRICKYEHATLAKDCPFQKECFKEE